MDQTRARASCDNLGEKGGRLEIKFAKMQEKELKNSKMGKKAGGRPVPAFCFSTIPI